MVGLERARLAPINWRVVVAVAKYVQGSEVRSALIKLLWKWKDVKWRSHDLSRTVGLARFREKKEIWKHLLAGVERSDAMEKRLFFVRSGAFFCFFFLFLLPIRWGRRTNVLLLGFLITYSTFSWFGIDRKAELLLLRTKLRHGVMDLSLSFSPSLRNRFSITLDTAESFFRRRKHTRYKCKRF